MGGGWARAVFHLVDLINLFGFRGSLPLGRPDRFVWSPCRGKYSTMNSPQKCRGGGGVSGYSVWVWRRGLTQYLSGPTIVSSIVAAIVFFAFLAFFLVFLSEP